MIKLHEKLELISALENENLDEEFIEDVVSSVENPDFLNESYKTVDDMLKAFEEDEDE